MQCNCRALRSIAFWVWWYWHWIGPCSDYTLMLLCRNFRITEEFQAARLFLSHYGFLSLEALKVGSKFITTTTQGSFLCIGESFEWSCWFFTQEQTNTSLPPSLVTLDTTNPGLTNDLEMLDAITARDNDTVHVFYVKSGQRSAADILRNVVSCQKIYLFL